MPINDYRITSNYGDKYWNTLKAQYGIPQKEDIDYFRNYYRFGIFDPYNEIQSGREFLFFTKPDLYILNSGGTLSEDLQQSPFFQELYQEYRHIIYELQYYRDPNNIPFSFLLSNMVSSSLDLPSLSATTVSTPVNAFGTSYDYRWTSEASDDNHQFSLEFKDTKYIDTYMLFRAYEEYERLKAQGVVRLYKGDEHYRNYIFNKVLHDQFGIYKFIVAEDMETIIHYSYFCGCIFTSLPRDSFNDANFDDGIKYGIDIKCAFVEDMNPLIISDFNNLLSDYNRGFNDSNIASVYDFENNKTDLLPVASPIIIKDIEYNPAKSRLSNSQNSGVNLKESYTNRYRYKLKWYRRN